MSDDKEFKLNYLKAYFMGTLKKCEGGAYDRKLFIAMYENLVRAVEEFYSLNVESPIIHVGFNIVYNEKFNELKELETSLKKRNMI